MALLGAHISASGGVDKAPQRAADIGCQSMQIFTRNQMRWDAKPLTDEAVSGYKAALKKLPPSFSVIVHDSYLINLGSPEPEKLKMSRDAFLDELERAEKLGVMGLAFHPGAHLNQVSEQECLKIVSESLNWVMQQCPKGKVKILIENTAGQGSTIGYRFEHLAEIIEGTDYPERLGVCFDTCHAFAAGYDFRKKSSYQQVFQDFDNIIGLQRLKAFHLNDAKKGLNSRVDRHEDIGFGHVGQEAFALLVNDPRFEDIPMVLETPGSHLDYEKTLVLLKSLVKVPQPS